MVASSNPNEVVAEIETAKRCITAWNEDNTKRLHAPSAVVHSFTKERIQHNPEGRSGSERRCVEDVDDMLWDPH